MQLITKKWIKMADDDIKTAQLLFNQGKKQGFAYQSCVFHCHQAIEKMMKAILCEQRKEIPKTHNVVRLLFLTEIDIPPALKRVVEDINPHYLLPRYPDLAFRPSFSFSYTKESTQRILYQTEKLLLCLKNHLQSKK